jgi:magnesium transporter
MIPRYRKGETHMARLMKRRSKKAGLPPGTLVHVGEKKIAEPRIAVIDYDEEHFQERQVQHVEECFIFRETPTVTWINVEGLHQVEILERLGECYGFHPLVLEDILNTDQRPKMEDYGDYIYIVLKMLSHNDDGNEFITEQVSIILGSNFVLSFQEGGEGDVFNPIRDRIKSSKSRIRKMGADYLAYGLLDAVVDNYFIVMEKLGEKIELLEEKLVTQPTPETLQTIHHLKQEMLFLRKALWPLREVISSLERGESPLFKDPTRIYLRDIYDHTIQVIDTIETYREMVSGMLDIYLSSVSNRLNSVMKVLTIIATIFMPLTFLAGIYGMNFKYMPELEWKWGYPFIWLVMVGIGVWMLLYFKKKRWL